MPKRPEVRVQTDHIDAAREKLTALAESGPSTFSLRAAVAELYPQVKAALARGHAYEAIAAAISSDVPLKPSTLATYIRDIERELADTKTLPPVPASPTDDTAKPRTAKPRSKSAKKAAPEASQAQSRHAAFDEDV